MAKEDFSYLVPKRRYTPEIGIFFLTATQLAPLVLDLLAMMRKRTVSHSEARHTVFVKGAMEGIYTAEVVKELTMRQGENEEVTENRQSRQVEDINEERNISKQERIKKCIKHELSAQEMY
ncbi:hypothetical protein QE152_g35998 [Popillia japonica]|uniref:Uncharacterized protein n=1 Tax=Popillia japonica TaxID=7064 RepID=A0AAW1IE38_POPJA